MKAQIPLDVPTCLNCFLYFLYWERMLHPSVPTAEVCSQGLFDSKGNFMLVHWNDSIPTVLPATLHTPLHHSLMCTSLECKYKSWTQTVMAVIGLNMDQLEKWLIGVHKYEHLYNFIAALQKLPDGQKFVEKLPSIWTLPSAQKGGTSLICVSSKSINLILIFNYF